MKNFIMAEELAHNMQNGIEEYTILDIRGDFDIQDDGFSAYEAGHIPGAQFVPPSWLTGAATVHGGICPLPDMEDFTARMAALGVEKNKPVIVYGSSFCLGLDARLWWMLRYMGISNVKRLYGGFQAWERAQYEVTTKVDPVEPKYLEMDLQKDMLVTMEDIKDMQKKDSHILIDVRSPEAFVGDINVLRSGHIPGAYNIFYGDLIGECGPSSDKLIREMLAPVLATGKETVTYCYAGISAPYAMSVLNEYGIDMKLYVGSMSDWLSYEDNSLEKGSR